MYILDKGVKHRLEGHKNVGLEYTMGTGLCFLSSSKPVELRKVHSQSRYSWYSLHCHKDQCCLWRYQINCMPLDQLPLCTGLAHTSVKAPEFLSKSCQKKCHIETKQE